MLLAKPSDTKLLKKGDPVTVTVFPSHIGAITGVSHIQHNHPNYVITYIDGTGEDAVIKSDDISFQNNEFAFVRVIQETSRGK